MSPPRVRFAVLPVLAAAGLGGLGARRAPEVYASLQRPRWAPPAGAFAPVWSLLYLTNVAAGWRIATRGRTGTQRLHLTQLGLNGLWPIVFFSARRHGISLLVIGGLDAALTLEVLRLGREDPRAARLLMPYLAWCGYATALNVAVSAPRGDG